MLLHMITQEGKDYQTIFADIAIIAPASGS